MFENNYTLGRGKLYFAQFLAGTRIPGAERYLGNTPEVGLNFESEDLEHFSSDFGLRELDRSIVMQITRSATFTTDNIDPRNVALFYFGSTEALTVGASSVEGEVLPPAEIGMFYQLGMTMLNPSGARNIVFPGTGATEFDLKKGAASLAVGTDFIINPAQGRIEVLEGGAIEDGDELTVDYSVAASTRKRIISGSAPVHGALRYIADNPEGDNIDYYLPSVSLAPNGEFALKGDDWQAIPFNVKVLKSDTREALYGDTRAISA